MATIDIQPINVKAVEMAKQVLALHQAAYALEARLAGLSSLPPMDRGTLQIQGLPESFFGAFVGGALAGAISVEEAHGTIELCSLAVHPIFQRQGVGRALLHHGLVLAAGRPLRVSTAAANLPAICLYQSAGFVVVGRRSVGSPPLPLVQLQLPQSR